MYLLPYIAVSLMCPAQGTADWELHGGYQFAGYQSKQFQSLVNSLTPLIGFPSATVTNNVNTNGWDLSVQDNMNDWFGGIFDASGGYGRERAYFTEPNGVRTHVNFRASTYTFGQGPQFTFRKSEQVQPFARVIFAGAYSYVGHNALGVNPLLAVAAIPANASDLAFTVIGGGGLDYRLSRHAYLRVAGDYIRTFFAGGGQSNFRLTTGVDFRIFTGWE